MRWGGVYLSSSNLFSSLRAMFPAVPWGSCVRRVRSSCARRLARTNIRAAPLIDERSEIAQWVGVNIDMEDRATFLRFAEVSC